MSIPKPNHLYAVQMNKSERQVLYFLRAISREAQLTSTMDIDDSFRDYFAQYPPIAVNEHDALELLELKRKEYWKKRFNKLRLGSFVSLRDKGVLRTTTLNGVEEAFFFDTTILEDKSGNRLKKRGNVIAWIAIVISILALAVSIIHPTQN